MAHSSAGLGPCHDHRAVGNSTFLIALDSMLSMRNPSVFPYRSARVTFTAAFLVAVSGCQTLKAPVLECKLLDPACLRRCSVQVGMNKDHVRALLLNRPERDSRPPGALGLEELWEWYWGYVSFGRDGRVEYTRVHWGSCPTKKSD
jgi:hypothetical protein